MATDLTFKPIGAQVQAFTGLERVADVDPRLTRSHYFDSRLLTAEDLNRDQLYLDGRLREVGQTLGYGVMRGLEISLDSFEGKVIVKPGIGVSRAGRVLELTRELTVDIGDRAQISELNRGLFRRIDRALYAVVVKYVELGTDIAEVFPTDLGTQRNFQYDVISEGVQISLVRLPQPLGQQNVMNLRANLLREWLGDNTAGGAVPEDGVALGVLAIANDRPQWLDDQLLRQPLRASNKPGDLQQDLSRRYERVFADLLDDRTQSGLGTDFAATDYFRLLPPVGSLPIGAINPVTGRQGFFPENFQVWTAPVRMSDMDLIRAESMALPPIDLSLGEPIDIIVMVPLSNSEYGQFAQRLERPTNTQTKLLPSQNLLRLRLFPQLPVHELDTDAATWQSIWNKVDPATLFYVRRPLRAAETRLSGIVLAQGIPVPPVVPATLPTPSDIGLLQSEDAAFLNRLNLEFLTSLRPAVDDASTDASKKMINVYSGDAAVTLQIASALIRIERRYDSVVWQTLLALADSKKLEEFNKLLIDEENSKSATGKIVANAGEDLKLDSSLAKAWGELVE